MDGGKQLELYGELTHYVRGLFNTRVPANQWMKLTENLHLPFPRISDVIRNTLEIVPNCVLSAMFLLAIKPICCAFPQLQ